MKKIYIGIAGFGVVGRRRKACIDAHPNLVTKVVCDKIFSEKTTLDDGTPAVSSIDALLSFDIDALVVCLTNDVAAQVTIAGLERGLHVFCEKPPGRNVEEI